MISVPSLALLGSPCAVVRTAFKLMKNPLWDGRSSLALLYKIKLLYLIKSRTAALSLSGISASTGWAVAILL